MSVSRAAWRQRSTEVLALPFVGMRQPSTQPQPRSSPSHTHHKHQTQHPAPAASKHPRPSSRPAKQRVETAFQKRLYEACQAIPKGKVATYGTLAAVLKSCARAVGQGMRNNPHAPIVPCHRVIASNLALGGFSGSWGEETENVKRKRAMLEDEGVKFNASKVAAGCVCSAEELLMLLSRKGLVQ